MRSAKEQYLERLREILCISSSDVGSTGAIYSDSPDMFAVYGKDWIKDFIPAPCAVAIPTTIEQVQNIVKLSSEFNVPIVPSGGRTGLSGGATATSGELVLSLEKINKIIKIESIDRTLTCQAGATTGQIQEAALKHGLFYPIDFASSGTSHIGGNIATNAGGIKVIRWGLTRDWVLGLKVVDSRGDLLDLNGALFKNQTGYDLRSLFIGSEGTLGIIVEVTLKLSTPPSEITRLMIALESYKDLPAVLQRVRQRFAFLNMFEYFSDKALAKVIEHKKVPHPFASSNYQSFTSYGLIELENNLSGGEDQIHEFFAQLIDEGLLQDVVLSNNSAHAAQLLSYRELISETLSSHYTIHKNDVSVPIPLLPNFLNDLDTFLADTTINPMKFEVIVFGHIGDGNSHLNYLKPADLSVDAFFAECKAIDHKIFRIIQLYKGSISAEHGVGLLKKEFLEYSRTPHEIQMMRGIKHALDPKNIFNPRKIF